jgi:predicted RNase H-like HicB family nuclease
MTAPREFNRQRQPIEFYLSLQYPISIYPENQGYTVMIPDLPGCMTQGETIAEAIANLNKAKELWIETTYASATKDIPLPSK